MPPSSAQSKSARPVERPSSERHAIAGTTRQALRVFEDAQLLGGVDQNVRIGADAIRSVKSQESVRPGRFRRPGWTSVIGQSPTVAPLAAMRSSSPSSTCVACTRHQRSSTSTRIHEPGHGPAPAPAQTVFHFFAFARRCGYARGRRAAMPITAASSSGVTARRLCGATPTTASSSDETACRLWSTSRAKRSTSLTKRDCRGSGAAPPNPEWA